MLLSDDVDCKWLGFTQRNCNYSHIQTKRFKKKANRTAENEIHIQNKKHSIHTSHGNVWVLSATGSAVNANVRQSASVEMGLMCWCANLCKQHVVIHCTQIPSLLATFWQNISKHYYYYHYYYYKPFWYANINVICKKSKNLNGPFIKI